jgi:hypothetical protein
MAMPLASAGGGSHEGTGPAVEGLAVLRLLARDNQVDGGGGTEAAMDEMALGLEQRQVLDPHGRHGQQLDGNGVHHAHGVPPATAIPLSDPPDHAVGQAQQGVDSIGIVELAQTLPVLLHHAVLLDGQSPAEAVDHIQVGGARFQRTQAVR